MLTTQYSSLNQLWASLLLEELCRRGIRHLCLAPGSRSTPLLLAAIRQPELQLHHHLDERGLGFMALGLAKGLPAGIRPTVAILTTSGTAVANLYPAVIEAAQTGVALVVISADRPLRLQSCGANQAIDQQGIFAAYPRTSLNLPPPSREFPADLLLTQIATTLGGISDSSGGVAHINCMFDEPLYPDGTTQEFADYLTCIAPWLRNGFPYPLKPISEEADSSPTLEQWQGFVTKPGLIVVGALPDHASAAAVKTLARELGWPIIADIQSQLKTDPDCLGVAELLLCDPQAAALFSQSRQLLQLGARLVSKQLQALVDLHPWEQFWLVHPGAIPLAPGRNQSHFFPAPVLEWCQQQRTSIDQLTQLPQQNQLNRQLFAQQSILTQRLAQQFSPQVHPQLSELAVAYQLLANSPDNSWLLAGNSLSIRLLDLIGGALPGKPQLFANRGASGIEGLVSTAIGCGRARQQAGTLLLGDYSLLYDLNALALLSDYPLPLVILVLNNDGGGIFRMLPIPDEALRQQHYQRPHGLNFEHACSLFKIRYQHPVSLPDFIVHYRKALHTQEPCVIEISADAQVTERQIRALTSGESST